MKHALERYKLYQRILLVLNQGIKDGIIKDEAPDEHIWNTIADHMDSIWHELTNEERDELRKTK